MKSLINREIGGGKYYRGKYYALLKTPGSPQKRNIALKISSFTARPTLLHASLI